MTTIRAVFWDIDGTMVTSEAVHAAKTMHMAAQHNIALSAEDMELFHGAGDPKAYELMRGFGMPGTLEEFVDACQDYYEAQLHLVDVRDGFSESFAYLDAQGIYQSAVSNGIERLVKVNLERAGIHAKLKTVVDMDYMVRSNLTPKPAADPYLDALRQVNEITGLSILPSECLVVEDSPTGVAAGKAAGMVTVYWKLSPDLTSHLADYGAHTASDLMGIIQKLVMGKAQAA